MLFMSTKRKQRITQNSKVLSHLSKESINLNDKQEHDATDFFCMKNRDFFISKLAVIQALDMLAEKKRKKT